MNEVRQIGDHVLQSIPKDYTPEQTAELAKQLTIMGHILHSTGGVGIAANQCTAIANPLKLIIVGNNHPVGRELAGKRYPGKEIPSETVMINPEIVAYSGIPYYPGEGCLSVKGGLRAKVLRYPTISVKYLNENGNTLIKDYQGFIAHIIQHEFDHLRGLVYLQAVFSELNETQRTQLLARIEAILTKRTNSNTQFAATPVFAFFRDDYNRLQIADDILDATLEHLEVTTLEGIKKLLLAPKETNSSQPIIAPT